MHLITIQTVEVESLTEKWKLKWQRPEPSPNQITGSYPNYQNFPLMNENAQG